MTKGKKRSRDEPEDPYPRPVKRQETGDAMSKMVININTSKLTFN
jgi:hypothetical protein